MLVFIATRLILMTALGRRQSPLHVVDA